MIKQGIYQHYKGNHYRVLFIATHSETDEKLVIYQPLYGDKSMRDSLWARPLAMFIEQVTLANGEQVERFKWMRAE